MLLDQSGDCDETMLANSGQDQSVSFFCEHGSDTSNEALSSEHHPSFCVKSKHIATA